MFSLFPSGYAIHKENVASWIHFASVMKGNHLSVVDQQTQRVREVVERNKQILHSIMDVVVTLGRQGIAFRGHRDSAKASGEQAEDKRNLGNFIEIMHIRARGTWGKLCMGILQSRYANRVTVDSFYFHLFLLLNRGGLYVKFESSQSKND